jgi:hypothetical protein
MIMKRWIPQLALCVCFVFAGCGKKEEPSETSPNQTENKSNPAPTGPPMATPKGSIAHQLKLLQEGKVEELRACFTKRQSKNITEAKVKEGQAGMKNVTLDDLFAKVKEGEFMGRKTAKIRMKNGRTLTTLVLTDGKWLSDTIWFR